MIARYCRNGAEVHGSSLNVFRQLVIGAFTHLLFFASLSQISCSSRMITQEGHRIFNPEYLWYLESEDRDFWQKPEQVIESLNISDGSVVADIGAGGGYFTEYFSRHVGTPGRVYAVDVQDELIEKLKLRIAERKLLNVLVIKGTFESPLLPEKSVDVAFFSSVYKEIDNRVAYMGEVRKSLNDSGKVAIIEFHKGRGVVGPPFRDRLREKTVINEMRKAGFSLDNRFEFLPKEYFLLFSKVGK